MKSMHLLFLVVFVVGACTTTNIHTPTAMATATNTLQVTGTLEEIAIPDTPTLPTPIPNTIYLVEYKGQVALFITSKYLRSYTNDNRTPIEGSGYLMPEKDKYFIEGIFSDFEDPQELIAIDEDVSWIGDFVIEPSSNLLYLSLIIRGSDKSDYNLLYKIDLNTLKADVIWKKEIVRWENVEENPYDEFRGFARINQVKEPYLELSILPCFRCTPCPPYGALILNRETSAEKFLGAAGNVEFNLDQSTFSYQLIAEDTECNKPSICPCEVEIAGPIYTETLP